MALVWPAPGARSPGVGVGGAGSEIGEHRVWRLEQSGLRAGWQLIWGCRRLRRQWW
jgi:hypothetical protein